MNPVSLVDSEFEFEYVKDIVSDCEARLDAEASRLHELDRWHDMDPRLLPMAPRNASREVRDLARMSRTPMLRLICDSVAQPLFVEGYRNADGSVESAWEWWMRNDLDSRQTAIHRAAVKYGYAFAFVVPGEDESLPFIRGVSPLSMWVEWADPVSDEFPLFAVRRFDRGRRFQFFDAQRVVELMRVGSGVESQLVVTSVVEHGAGVVPVVRFENLLDLEGNCVGEVEPYIDMVSRINKTCYDRLMVQHFNSWKVIFATGMVPPEDSTPEQREAMKVQIRQDDIIVGGEGVKFGQLDETSMGGFLEAMRLDIETLAAMSQTPTSNLTGQMVNLSADALAAARSPLVEKIRERQRRFGDSWAKLLRVAGSIAGDDGVANDFDARIVWRDAETRSLAQVVDALGKAAQMLGAPKRALWSMLPDVSQSDVEEWVREADVEAERELNKQLMELAAFQDVESSADSGGYGGYDEYSHERRFGGGRTARDASSQRFIEQRKRKNLDPRRRRKRDGDGDGIYDE